MVRARWLSVAAVATLGAPFAVHAAGTPAGTNSQNTAQVSYTVGASTVTATSNTSSVTVAEIVDAVLTIANATVQVAPGSLAEELVFTLTNTATAVYTIVPLYGQTKPYKSGSSIPIKITDRCAEKLTSPGRRMGYDGPTLGIPGLEGMAADAGGGAEARGLVPAGDRRGARRL